MTDKILQYTFGKTRFEITYLINGDSTSNTIHCKILSENEIEYRVIINDELERSIKKEKITKFKKLVNNPE